MSNQNKPRVHVHPFYYYSNDPQHPRWVPTFKPSESHSQNYDHSSTNSVDTFRLITWNIDFQVPAANERMTAALEYLKQLILTGENGSLGPPTVVFLQEMVDSDIELIKTQPWIRDHFFITDVSDQKWIGYYATTTLIDKRLSPQRVFRVPYKSRYQRDGLFVDIGIETHAESGTANITNLSPSSPKAVVRLCNTHLESLVSVPPLRPIQMKVASEFMHGTETTSIPRDGDGGDPLSFPIPHAALLAGDLNAFAPEDATAPQECGLQDTFLVLGGEDGTEESFTWGQQVPDWLREKFGCSRMDKILFCGRVEALNLERIGAGIKARVEYPPREPDDTDDSEDGEEVWVTDHLGLSAEFKVLSAA